MESKEKKNVKCTPTHKNL